MIMKDFNLENQPKINTGFEVPNGYFDSFSEKIMTKISASDLKESPKVISLLDRNRKWMISIAASFVVFIVAGYYFYNSNNLTIETTEIEHFIVNNSTLTDDDIASLLDENDIQKLTIDYNLENISTENIDLETLDLEENL
jgi:hypothetical protein